MEHSTNQTLCAICGCSEDMHRGDKLVLFSDYVDPQPGFTVSLLRCEGFIDSGLVIQYNTTSNDIARAVQAHASQPRQKP